MLAWKRWTAIAAVGGVLLLGGLGTAASQQAEGPVMNADSLATAMQLDDQGRADLEQLAELVERRMEVRQQMQAMHGEMMGVMQSLQGRLTREQMVQLHRAMQGAMRQGAAMGPGMGMGMRSGQGMHMGAHHQGMMGGRGGAGMGSRSGASGWMHQDCPWVTGGSQDTGDSGN